MRDVHVHADEGAGEADRNRDEGCSERADRCRARIRSGEDGLDVALRAEDADEQREDADECVLDTIADEREPRERRKCGTKSRVPRDGAPCEDAGDEQAAPEDGRLDHTADAGALEAAEEAVAGNEHREGERCCPGREPCQRRENRDARQAARNSGEEDAERRHDRREVARALAVVQHEILGDRLERRAAQRLCVEQAHDDEREARADREPPGRKSDRAGKLCRADRCAAADAGAGNRASDHWHARRASAEAEALRRMHGASRINAAAERNGNRHGDDGDLEDGKLHESGLLSSCFH